MTITKILETTLVAGQTSVSFTDAEIPNSILRVYPSDSDLIYESISLTSTTLTVTYPAQTANKSIALEIIKAGLEVIDSLTSTDTNNALSAKQGKTLNDAIVLVSGNLDTLTETVNNLDIPDSITDLSDVVVTSIQDGQVLAWDDVSQKFVNVNQSGGGSTGLNYSTTEQEVGTWIDGSKIYSITIPLDDLTIPQNNRVLIGLGNYISNLNNIIKGEVIVIDGTTNIVLPSFQISTMSTYGLTFTMNKTDGIVISRGNASGTVTYDFIATVWYTKTS